VDNASTDDTLEFLQKEYPQIDILHIDGNHFEDIALGDAEIWLPKVKKGGYIWFDDANWPETRRAVQFMKENCDLDMERSIGDDCYLFQKN